VKQEILARLERLERLERLVLQAREQLVKRVKQETLAQ